MKCFIHPNKESVAACSKCGKAMCVDCSSFSTHSGICPACRKNDMDKELVVLKKQIKSKRSKLKAAFILTVLTGILIIPILIYRSTKTNINRDISKLQEKVDSINKSLTFVNEALSRGTGDLSTSSPVVEDVSEDAWQCPFCRTINQSGRTCKFCARKKV